jgi:hypothetical protein
MEKNTTASDKRFDSNTHAALCQFMLFWQILGNNFRLFMQGLEKRIKSLIPRPLARVPLELLQLSLAS